MERDTRQEAAQQPLNIPKRKDSGLLLCDSSSHHELITLDSASQLGLDIDDSFHDTCVPTKFDSPDPELPQPQQTSQVEMPSQPQESFEESDDDFAETDLDDDNDDGNDFPETDDDAVEEDNEVAEDEDESSSSEQSSAQDEEETTQPLAMPHNNSSPSFDAMLQRFDMGTCIVDLKKQRDCLNSPLKDGSNATGDDPPTYPTHLTSKFGEEPDEEDSTYREEDEEVPLRSSPSSKDRRRTPRTITTQTHAPSISNSVGSNISSPQPYYAKATNPPTNGSTGLSASYRTGGEESTGLESESTTFLLTEERVRAFMVDYYDDMDSIGRSKECLETFFRHYCIPELRWMRPSGNPIDLDGLIELFTEDLKVDKMWLVSVDSIQILAGGMAAVVTITADQTFYYHGVHNGDRAVISSVLEVVNRGREIKIVHEHRTSGRPIPKETRWSTTES